MSGLRTLAAVVVIVAAMTMCADPVLTNPSNGNGNSSSGNHDNSGNKGNSGHSQRGHADQKNDVQSRRRKNYGKPGHVDGNISYNVARQYTIRYDLTGYKSLPPGIAKNLARGKSFPPGIARKNVPPSMLNRLPYYPGYEWQVIGDNLVLIVLSTAIVIVITNGVFD